MKKSEEIANPYSCLNKAGDDEFVFVLRETDPASAPAVRAWIKGRIDSGKNKMSDKKLDGAFEFFREVESADPPGFARPIVPPGTTNKDLLQFIYKRLVNVHGEGTNIDYMRKLLSIINQADGR